MRRQDRAAEPGSAEPRLGEFPHRGWYARYLPHRDDPGLLQAITYRLADSLPAEVLRRLRLDLARFPLAKRSAEERRRIERWLDAGYGACLLRDPENATSVIDTWRRFDGERYDLVAWVVMPNHAHVLVRTYRGVPLGTIVQSWKSYTGRVIAQRRAGARRSRVSSQVWQREYWDRYIRDENHFTATIDYIHQNPVKAGLVRRAEDWPWSSAGSAKPGSAEPRLGVILTPHSRSTPD